jgi:hypothetical protein
MMAATDAMLWLMDYHDTQFRDVVKTEATRLQLCADLYPFQPGVVELVRGLEKGLILGYGN